MSPFYALVLPLAINLAKIGMLLLLTVFFLCKCHHYPISVSNHTPFLVAHHRPVFLRVPYTYHIRVGCTLDVATKCEYAVSSAHAGGNATSTP